MKKLTDKFHSAFDGVLLPRCRNDPNISWKFMQAWRFFAFILSLWGRVKLLVAHSFHVQRLIMKTCWTLRRGGWLTHWKPVDCLSSGSDSPTRQLFWGLVILLRIFYFCCGDAIAIITQDADTEGEHNDRTLTKLRKKAIHDQQNKQHKTESIKIFNRKQFFKVSTKRGNSWKWASFKISP